MLRDLSSSMFVNRDLLLLVKVNDDIAKKLREVLTYDCFVFV